MKDKVLFMAIGLIVAISSNAWANIETKAGGSLRLRHEYLQNLNDMDNDQKDNRNYFRVRTSLWGQVDYEKSFSLFAKLTDEFKPYTYFAGTTSSVPDKTAGKKGYHFDINEVVFDNLYFDLKKPLDLPWNLRIGRQDFAGDYGEGFLIFDGTPNDGSRTFYFNAAKAAWSVNDKNSLDFIYINDQRDEETLPSINPTKLVNASNPRLDKVPQSLTTTDEQAGVLYWKNKDLKNLAFEGYYIYKYEAEEGGRGLQSQRGRINTLGSFSKYSLGSWALRWQFANQFGDYGANGRRGFGGYGYVDKNINSLLWTPQLSLGYIYLSGDKTSTARNEAWDPLFSRAPWLSEIYGASFGTENGVSYYWSNLQMYRTSLVLSPSKKLKLSFWYNFLRANAQVAPSAVFSGTGKTRGNLLQSKIEYVFNKNVSTFFLAEYLIPGNFYKDKDPAIFLRSELSVKF